MGRDYQCKNPPHAVTTNSDNAQASAKPRTTATECGNRPAWQFSRRGNLIEIKDARHVLTLYPKRSKVRPAGRSQRRLSDARAAERDQCQAKLDILIEGFMRADWAAYRDTVAWLRDFADQKNTDMGRVMCGGRWFTPQRIEAVRERARSAAAKSRLSVACVPNPPPPPASPPAHSGF